MTRHVDPRAASGMLAVQVVMIFVLSLGEQARSQFSASGPSDLTLAMQMEINGITMAGKTRIKGRNTRMDLENTPKGAISHIQTEAGRTFILFHCTKVWQDIQPKTEAPTTISDEDRQKLRDVFKMRFTGKTKNISGWSCEEFILFDGTSLPDKAYQARIIAWIAKDFPEGSSLQKLVESSAPNEQLKSFERLTGTSMSLPGFALKMEIQKKTERTILTFTAIKQEILPDSLFQIPPEYLQSLAK